MDTFLRFPRNLEPSWWLSLFQNHFARWSLVRGKTQALEKIEQTGGPPKEFYVDGSEDHYQYFQGLISGDLDKVVDKYRRIFPAQILRDSAFAYTVMDIVQKSDGKTKVLGICGSGHLDHRFGIPEKDITGGSYLCANITSGGWSSRTWCCRLHLSIHISTFALEGDWGREGGQDHVSCQSFHFKVALYHFFSFWW